MRRIRRGKRILTAALSVLLTASALPAAALAKGQTSDAALETGGG